MSQPEGQVPEPEQTTPEDSVNLDEVLKTTNGGGLPQSVADRPTGLDDTEANALAAQRRPTVIVLAGPVHSGKTSIYAAIYERLGRGPFAGWTFAGSRTIPGLEARCHWWRHGSGLSTPDMEATRAGSPPWLHLRMRDVEGLDSPKDVLFADFEGEIFEHLLDGRKSASDLPFLRRADHVGLVIDGDKMSDSYQRTAAREQCKYLIRALLAPDGLASPAALSLIVTKLDLLVGKDKDQTAVIDEAISDIRAEASSMGAEPVGLYRVAVRSRTATFPLGHGLEQLLELFFLKPALKIGGPPELEIPRSPSDWLIP